MPRNKKIILAHLALLGVTSFYSGNFIIAQDVMHGEIISPIVLVFFRVFGAGILFWILHSITTKEKIERKHFMYLFLCSFIGIVLAHNTYLFGLEKTTTINASLIISTTPIMVMIFSSVLLGSKMHWNNVVGLLVSVLGVVLLVVYSNRQSIEFLTEHRIGNLLILGNAFSYGLYMVLIKKLLKHYQALTVIKWIFTLAAPIILVISWPQLQTLDWGEIRGNTLIALLYVIIFATFFTYSLNVYAIKILTPFIAVLYLYMQPFLTSILSIYFGKDVLTPLKVISGILILSGLYLAVFYKRRKSEA